jgi:hypothetical protein
MRSETLPTEIPANRQKTGSEGAQNTILRAVATLALRFALVSLKLWAPRSHSPVTKRT